MSKSALRLWKFDVGSSTSSTGSLTFWCLSEPPPPPPPSLLKILVPPSTLICLFMPLLYLSTYCATCSTVGELDSIFPYFLCIYEYIGYKHTSPRPNDMLVSRVLCKRSRLPISKLSSSLLAPQFERHCLVELVGGKAGTGLSGREKAPRGNPGSSPSS